MTSAIKQENVKQRLFRIRKECLTLVEILIVIALLSLVAGFIAINISKAVREQRFRSEVDRVAGLLRTAQDLMLIMDIEVRVKFGQDPHDKGIRLWMETTAPLPVKWEGLLLHPQPNLTQIHWVQFADAEEGSLEIVFLSGGISKGLLRLSTSENDDDLGALTRYICLPGYPKPIFSVHNPEEDPACDFENEEDYVKNLTRFMYEEVRSLPGFKEEEPSENDEKGGKEASNPS